MQATAIKTSNSLNALASQNKLEEVAIELIGYVKEAAEKAIPKVKPSEYSKPWWNEELKRLQGLYHKAQRQYKAYKEPTLLKEAREARNTYYQAIKKAKSAH